MASVRAAALALLVAVGGHVDDTNRFEHGPERNRPLFAGLAESVPKLFVDIVNDKLKGRIDPKTIRYDAPSSVILEDARLLDPRGAIVARVKSARATLDLSELLSGEIVVSRVDLEGASLDLVLHDKELNLIEALTPKKPPEKKGDAKTAFRIDEIRATNASFRFTDEKNVTVTASGIGATASLEIDLARELVIVDVKQPRVASGKVETKEVDVPIANVAAKQLIVYRDRVDVYDASAVAAGANVTAAGSIMVKDPGNLALKGYINAPANAWPEKLKRLPFETPALKGKVDVNGPFSEPIVSVDATFGNASAYGYKADSGRGVVVVTPKLVTIKEGTQLKAGSGTVNVEGTVQLPELQMELKTRAVDVPLAIALAPAKLDPAPRGTVTARATIKGVADGKAPLYVDAHGTGRRVEITSVKPGGDVTLDARVTVRPEHVVIESATITGSGIDGRVRGDVYVKEERVALNVTATAENAARLVDEVPPEIKLEAAAFSGTVSGPYKTVVVEGEVNGVGGDAFGVPVDEMSAHLVASAQQVTLRNVKARAAGGNLKSTTDVVIALKGAKSITGTVVADKVNLALIRASDGSELPLSGRADAEAKLSGPYNDPTVNVRASAGGVAISGEKLGAATARLRVTKKLLTVVDAQVDGPVTRADTTGLIMTLPNLDVTGTVRVRRVDLAMITAAASAELAGEAQGLVVVRGDARQPTLTATLDVVNFAIGPQRLGDGPVTLGLAPDSAGTSASGAAGKGASAGERRHIASVAAKLASDIGVLDIESSIAIQRRVINAKARFTDVDLAPFTKHLGESVAPLEGYASGSVEAWGPLDKLSLRTKLRVPEVAVAPSRAPDDARVAEERAAVVGNSSGNGAQQVPLLRPLGELVVDARMDAGELIAKVCAFPVRAATGRAPVPATSTSTSTTGAPAPAASASVPASGVESGESPCKNDVRVWATVQGPVDVQSGAFDLGVDGLFDEPALQDLMPAIAARGFEVGAKTRASAQLTREKGKPVEIRAEATLLSASVKPPGELRADLVGTADVLYADERVFLEKPARFRAPNGEIDVTVGGAVGSEDIALDIEGSAALALGKVFTEQIANARGTAQTELSIRGRYKEGVAIEGTLTPSPGAVVTPRSLGQPITFQEGSLRFAPVAAKPGQRGESGLLTITANDIRAKLGDGDVQLRGSVDARTARGPDQAWVARWDLALNGSGLEMKLPTGKAEGAADLVLTGTSEAPVLRGRVELTDGTYKKTLELRNFVLEAPKGRPSDPLWVTLAPFGLGNLELDVDVALQNFRVRVNVASFDADMSLRGNLKVQKMLRLPVINGAVEVEEGVIAFPRARFEIIEMQVEFPSTGDGRINPLVHLTARAEIPPGGAGGNDTEIPVDLFLDGSLEDGINVDLVATDPTRERSRSELLGIIVFGRSLEETVQDPDLSLAFRALLNEASAPLTQEIEDLVQETFGVDVEIAATSWRWQLGRRLQIEGDVVLIDEQAQPTESNTQAVTSAGATGATTTTQYDTLRLRLLILDHLPVGRALSLEGRNSEQSGGDLRLTLRLFEE